MSNNKKLPNDKSFPYSDSDINKDFFKFINFVDNGGTSPLISRDALMALRDLAMFYYGKFIDIAGLDFAMLQYYNFDVVIISCCGVFNAIEIVKGAEIFKSDQIEAVGENFSGDIADINIRGIDPYTYRIPGTNSTRVIYDTKDEMEAQIDAIYLPIKTACEYAIAKFINARASNKIPFNLGYDGLDFANISDCIKHYIEVRQREAEPQRPNIHH